jgi:hypothetical protein
MAGKHQGLENKHQRLLELAKTEPLQAAIEARDDLKASKKGRAYMSSIRQLDRIISGDESAWHYGARDLTEAVQFIITNLMLKSAGLGVIPPNVRNESNIARMVGNLISEDVDFAPMTTAQKRLKMIAESYGFQVYTLNEMDEDEANAAQRRYDGDQERDMPERDKPSNELRVDITYDDGDSRGMSVLNDGTVVLWVSEGYSDVTIIKTEDGYPEHIEDIDSNVDHPINRVLQNSFETGQGARETMPAEMVVLWEIARNHGR